MEKDLSLGRYYFLMLTFLASMLLLVIANSSILFLLAWELTSLCSFSLIGHWYFKPESLRGALKAILITELGSVSLFLGFILCNASTLTSLKPVMGVSILLLLGALTKSAQYPFLIWLPDAMEAPTPVSAYLHAAAMVKAGVYLLARMQLMGMIDNLSQVIAFLLGILSMVAGGILMLFQDDVKRVLAYSTISHLGLLFSSLSLGVAGMIAGLLHFLNHAVAKATLFLCSGAVEHETGERNLGMLGGLFKSMPLSAFVFIISALSLSGVPPLGGFLSKFLIFIVSLSPLSGLLGKLLAVVLVISSLFTFMGLLRVTGGIFFGTPAKEYHAKEPPPDMFAPLLLLATAVIILGLAPTQVISWVSTVLESKDLEMINLATVNILALTLTIVPLIAGGAIYMLLTLQPKKTRDLYLCGEDPNLFYASSVKIYEFLREKTGKCFGLLELDSFFTYFATQANLYLTRWLTSNITRMIGYLLVFLLFVLYFSTWVIGK
jgi:NADH:ubiquinone oxidoreductase subunit 5 (subunit L)/multisubunit Na+/H+ antiporter MnhA subunit